MRNNIVLQGTTKPILIYPNSGETYDPDRKEWVVSYFPMQTTSPHGFLDLSVLEWSSH